MGPAAGLLQPFRERRWKARVSPERLSEVQLWSGWSFRWLVFHASSGSLFEVLGLLGFSQGCFVKKAASLERLCNRYCQETV